MNDEEKADFASREGGKNLISRQKLKLDIVCKYRLLEKGFEENKFETCRLHRSVSKVFKAKLFSTSSLLNLFTNSRNFLKLLLLVSVSGRINQNSLVLKSVFSGTPM